MNLIQDQLEALNIQNNSVTETLKETRLRWRQAISYKTSLQNRLKAANEGTPTVSYSNPMPQHSQAAPATTSHPPSSAASVHQVAVESLHSHYTQLVPTSAARAHLAARLLPSARHDTGNAPGAWNDAVRRPESSFARCEPLTLAAVCDFVAPGEEPKEALMYSTLAHAVSAYKHNVSARTGVPIADICWFLQCKIPGVEPSLSFSAHVSSPERNLSVFVCKHLSALESMLLVAEHEMLLEASDPSYKPPEHPTIAAASAAVAPPNPPDPQLLKRFHLPCGVNQRVPLGVGLGRSLQPLLAKYSANLPMQRWRAVCMQSMRIMQAYLDALAEPQNRKCTPQLILCRRTSVLDLTVETMSQTLRRKTHRSMRIRCRLFLSTVWICQLVYGELYGFPEACMGDQGYINVAYRMHFGPDMYDA